MRKIGSRIREARLAADLNQDALAKALGMSRALIGHWESDVREPTATGIAKLALKLHVSADWLLGLPDGWPGKRSSS